MAIPILTLLLSGFSKMSVNNGAKEMEFSSPDPKVVEDVSQDTFAQAETLKYDQKTLQSLEATLSEVETKCKQAEIDLRSKVRMILALESDMEHSEQQTQLLMDRCTAVSLNISELQGLIREEQEKASSAQTLFSTYRAKMEEHRAAVMFTISQTPAHKELEMRRAQVRKLQQKKEELKDDLENPRGDFVQTAKREIDALKAQIMSRKKAIAEKGNKLQMEMEMHTQIKKDIEIQNRRYDAIVKRLHCQLSRAQAAHRQMSADIHHMERQIFELRRRLDTSQVPK